MNLTVRDEQLLRAVNRFRLARSSDLRSLLFAHRSAGRCAERLRQLFHAGYLEVRLGRLSEENIYSLGPAGRRWLEEREVPIGRLPSGGIAHHLAIVASWVRLAAALDRNGCFRLVQCRADWELRQHQHRLGLPVVPDALMELIAPNGSAVHLAVEVDLATERHGALRRKLDGYRQLASVARHQWGWTDLVLAVVVWQGGARREQALRRLVRRHWPQAFVLSPWTSWPASLLHVLPPLTAPTDGKRGAANTTSFGATASQEDEAELSRQEMAGSGVDS